MSQTLKVVFSKWKYALGILGLFLLSAALGGAAAYVTTKIGNRPAGVSLPLGYKLSVVLWLPELAKAYYSKAVPSTFIGKGTFLRAEAAIALAAGRPAEAIEKANAAIAELSKRNSKTRTGAPTGPIQPGYGSCWQRQRQKLLCLLQYNLLPAKIRNFELLKR